MKLSPGITTISRPITLRHGEHLTGCGKANSVLLQAPDFVGEAMVIVETNEGESDKHNRHCLMSDLTIRGRNRTVDGIFASGSAMLTIDRVEAELCKTAIAIENVSIVTKIDDCKINNNARGIVARDNANGLKILNSRIQASQYENVIVDGPATFSILIQGCYIESSGLLEPSPGVSIGASGLVNCFLIQGCGFEKNRCGDLGQIRIGTQSGQEVAGGSIIANSIIGDGIAAKSRIGINIEKAYNVSLMGNRLAAHRTAAVRLDTAARGCYWYGGHVDYIGGQDPPSVQFVEIGSWHIKNQYI